MKKWIVTSTEDRATFTQKEIEGENLTSAYVNFSVKYPKAEICEMEERN